MLGQVASGSVLILRASLAWLARWVDELTTGTVVPGGGGDGMGSGAPAVSVWGGGAGAADAARAACDGAAAAHGAGASTGDVDGNGAGADAAACDEGGAGGAAGAGDAAGAGAAVEAGAAGVEMTSMGVMSGREEAGLPSLALVKSADGPDTKLPTRLWAQGSFITVCSKDSAFTTSDTVSSETPVGPWKQRDQA